MFDLLRNNATEAELSNYFGLFDEIVQYVPYSVVISSRFDKINAVLGTKATAHSFLNLNEAQIRYVQNEFHPYSQSENFKETLFEDPNSALNKTRIVFANTPFY